MTHATAIAASPAFPARVAGRLRALVAEPRTWLVAALIGDGLLWLGGGGDASNLRFLDPLVLVLGLALWIAEDRWSFRERLRIPRRLAPLMFVAVGLLAGLAVEFAIAAGGDGYGGLHEDTRKSFALFPGYYVPAILLALWLVRRLALDRRQAFFAGAAFGAYEAITVGALALLSPGFVFAPFLAAYYGTVYALIGMGGILLVPERLLHRPGAAPVTTKRALTYALPAGLLAWVAFMAWAGVVAVVGVVQW